MVKELKKLGGDLKKERQSRNIELTKIADKTKISQNFLEKIEAGDFDFLPEPYPRNFLRSYLQALGGFTEQFLDRYDDIMFKMQKPEPDEKETVKQVYTAPPGGANVTLVARFNALKNKHLPVFVVSAVVILLILTILSISKNKTQSTIQTPAEEQTIVQQDSQLAAFSPFSLTKKKLKLNLVASQKTWLQIAIDDSAAIEYIFKSEDSSIWYAKEKFLMRIGNGAGVRLYLNGNDLGQLGKEGEVVKLLLTKDGIQHSNF